MRTRCNTHVHVKRMSFVQLYYCVVVNVDAGISMGSSKPTYTRSPITTAYFDIFLATPTALAQMRPKASRSFLGFHGIDPNIVTIT